MEGAYCGNVTSREDEIAKDSLTCLTEFRNALTKNCNLATKCHNWARKCHNSTTKCHNNWAIEKYTQEKWMVKEQY